MLTMFPITNSWNPHNADLAIVVELIKFSRKMGNTEPMSFLMGDEVRPGPQYQTDEEIAEWVKREITTTWRMSHPSIMLSRERANTDK